MKEDIKILEKLINVYKELKKDFEEGHASSYEMQFEDFKALENLLTRYKQLEEENKHYKKYAVMMTTEGLLINGVKFSFNDYIPKSKVKEKIEEYEKLYIDDPEGFRKAHFRVAIEVLQELLGEE